MAEHKIEISSPALEKLVEVVASGVGALARPWMRRRDARADIDVERIHLLGMRDLDDLRAKLLLPAPGATEVEGEIVEEAPLPLLRRVERRVEYQEGKRQVNIEDIVAEASQDLVRDGKVAADPVDEDWTARFFGHAQDVSSKRMKNPVGKDSRR